MMMRLPAGKWASGRLAKVSQVIAANGYNNVVSLLITLHAARRLGPQDFGQLGLVLAVVVFGVVVLDMGVSVSLVRNYNHDPDPEARVALVGGVMKAKMLQVILGFAFAYPAARAVQLVFPEIRDVRCLAVGIASAALMSLWTTVRSFEQARRNYSSFTRYVYLLGTLRLAAYGGVVLLGSMSDLSVVLCLYFIPLCLLLLYSIAFQLRRYLAPTGARSGAELQAVRAALQYGAWVAGASILLSLMTRMPLFFLARRSSGTELGFFTAALTFVTGFGLIWDAMSTVIMPEVSGLHTPESRLQFQRILLRKLPLMAGVLATIIAACLVVQNLMLGPAYRGSTAAFLVLGIITAACMCISVNNTLVHAYGIPSALTYMNVARLILVVVGLGVWLQPTALDAAAIYGVVLLAGDIGLFLHIQRRVTRDRIALRPLTT